MIYKDVLHVQNRQVNRSASERLADLFEEVILGCPCLIEPLDKELAVSFMGIATESLQVRIFTPPDSTPVINIGDRVRVTTGRYTGKTFSVQLVKDFSDAPCPHFEIGGEEVTGV